MVRPCIHFVGFRGDEYGSAVRVWGEPDFIHRFWDRRAQRDIAQEDTVIFASGEWDQRPRARNADDLIEDHYPDSRIVEKYASGGLFAVDT